MRESLRASIVGHFNVRGCGQKGVVGQSEAIATRVMHAGMSKMKCREIYMLATNTGVFPIKKNTYLPCANCNK